MPELETSLLLQELRGWQTGPELSDDASRMVWLMHLAADEIDQLREASRLTLAPQGLRAIADMLEAAINDELKRDGVGGPNGLVLGPLVQMDARRENSSLRQAISLLRNAASYGFAMSKEC